MPTADDPTPATMVQIAKVARQARVNRTWSQGDLAGAAGVSRPTVARIEAGHEVSTSSLAKVAAALGLRVALNPGSGAQVRSRVALPEDDYLMRIGEVAYTVSSLEWTLLGDLHRLSSRLPEDLHLASLEPQTTGQIAARAKTAAGTTYDLAIRAYLTAVGDALSAAARIRNDVLHARPATHPTQDQRLMRAEVVQRETTGSRFWIDGEWFDWAIEELNQWTSAVSAVRPPFDEG